MSEFAHYGVVQGAAEQSIAFFLPDTFGMLPFISAIEPLRAANRYSGRALYQWHLLVQAEPIRRRRCTMN